LYGAQRLGGLADVYIKVNEPELAIDQIEYLLTIPSYYHVNILRLHPSCDPLRNNPRFRKLIGEPVS